ncbi:hypothetical protein [Vibrio sp. L3-7]|uniref:hypothetical protein n=1 Tax=Vibrio sp. L3-7 TaxID=2912253 RepID=UPI001F450530|nr:hypothetical protein [Vibrio sp. L3-7]MCF7506119.1 hypothetical protein [Vibrio sp. L3-7]
MNKQLKGLLMGWWVICASVLTFIGGAWLANHIYINPLTEERVNKLIAGPYMFISFVSGSTIGFLMFIAPMNTISRLFRGRKLHIKTIAILLFIFGASGVGANASIYLFVINPNNMLECPKKSGYKENLMRGYVSDISLCEKF